MTNRNKIFQWFITFPQCGEITVTEFLKKCFTETQLEEYAGVIENHDDGGKHIHVNIKLKFGLTKVKLLNLMRIKYPDDYKRIDMRSTRQKCKQAADGYLSKEGNDVTSKLIDRESAKKKKRSEAYKFICDQKESHFKNSDGSYNEIGYLNWVVDSGMVNKL